MKFRAVIFDLDGVIVSTDNLHYNAWKKLADKEKIYFDREINERLRGVSRMESLEIILEKTERKYAQKEKAELADFKNEEYKKLLSFLNPDDILKGVSAFLSYLKSNNIKVAIGSSSKNTKLILEQLNLDGCFDAVADGNDIKKSKPDPEVFLCASKKLGEKPENCLVIEDALSGVEAGICGGFTVLAVGYASKFNIASYNEADLSDLEKLKVIMNK